MKLHTQPKTNIMLSNTLSKKKFVIRPNIENTDIKVKHALHDKCDKGYNGDQDQEQDLDPDTSQSHAQD